MTAETEPRLELEVQHASEISDVPEDEALHAWALAAVGELPGPVELVIRIVDERESRALNARYRGKDKPTNVLSFPFEAPPGVEVRTTSATWSSVPPVVAREAAEQHKPLDDHWAHMVVHGVLHLRGYDHLDGQTGE